MSPPDLVLRTGARVLLLDAAGRVLLLRGRDPHRPDAPAYWFTVGGGLEPGESPRQGARRETREETGILLRDADLAGPVWREVAEFDFGGRPYRQDQEFFVARVGCAEVDTSGFHDVERGSIDAHRWWTADELDTTAETVYPRGLARLVREALGVAAGA